MSRPNCQTLLVAVTMAEFAITVGSGLAALPPRVEAVRERRVTLSVGARDGVEIGMGGSIRETQSAGAFGAFAESYPAHEGADYADEERDAAQKAVVGSRLAKEAESLAQQAEDLLAMKELHQALQKARAALTKDPANLRARAIVTAAEGMSSKSEAETLAQQAEELLAVQETDRALEKAREALAKDPENVRARAIVAPTTFPMVIPTVGGKLTLDPYAVTCSQPPLRGTVPWTDVAQVCRPTGQGVLRVITRAGRTYSFEVTGLPGQPAGRASSIDRVLGGLGAAKEQGRFQSAGVSLTLRCDK